jgi:integral membrane protein (TIGR01906 family)
MFVKFYTILFNLLINFLILIISLYVSWNIASKNNFFYNTLYDRLDIDKHIKKYSIKNTDVQKRYFYFTDKKTHINIFHQIVNEINGDGENLDEISFNFKDKKIKFLTNEEIIHLKDVVYLVKNFKYVIFFVIFPVLFFILLIMKLKNIKFFGIFPNIFLFSGFLLTFLMIFNFIGFKKIFTYFHEIFFKNSQWFFYYEDSLMTTLMKAPDIFFYISLILLVLTVTIHIFIISFLIFLLKK